MAHLESRPFRNFLEFVEGQVGAHIIVFRVPFVDREVLERIRSALNDIMYVRTVAFPPLGIEDLVAWGAKELDKYGFQLSKEARPYLQERLMLERSDGKFYGLNTVRKVVRELLYKKQLRNARKKRITKTISATDAKLICGELNKKLTGEQMLADMVGGEKMKEQIASIISQIEMSREEGASAPCIHMRFSGNPGTGKTTVARIIGKILKEKGLLRIGNFYEYAGRDFCGRYIGETAPKTASMCRDAYGSVLFIDEAYSLYRGDGNDKDYGREAIDTLIAEMENHRHDLVVIMAGYKDDMETLMKGNSGLASRMPYLIEFPNFTRDELYRIFENMSKKKWQCEKGYLQEARAYFDRLPDSVLNSKEFSNARFVRNLYERAWAKAMLRCQLNKGSAKTLTRDDFVRAAADKEFAFNEKKKTRLGFYEE
jgi:SpoVK/Ycf46/Vps4 family AAA+-type ATPase